MMAGRVEARAMRFEADAVPSPPQDSLVDGGPGASVSEVPARQVSPGDEMKTFYFIGGPTPGREDAFFHRLAQVGGPPSGWSIYPHATDGRALHIVRAANEAPIIAHVAQLGPDYERGPIVEVVPRPRQSPGETTAPAIDQPDPGPEPEAVAKRRRSEER